MKNIITAIGNPKLNNLIKAQKTIIVKGKDIQYQEGIFEALDKHKDIDGIIIREDIIGELELEDLIRGIIMLKNDIEMILITNQEKQKLQNENVIKIIDNNSNYVNEITKYLFGEIYIKQKNETELIEDNAEDELTQKEDIVENNIRLKKRNTIRALLENVTKQMIKLVKKQKTTSKIITILGSAGVRQDNIYINYIKNNQEQKSFNHRFWFNK